MSAQLLAIPRETWHPCYDTANPGTDENTAQAVDVLNTGKALRRLFGGKEGIARLS